MEKYYYEKKQEDRLNDSDEYVRKEDSSKTETQKSSISKNYTEDSQMDEKQSDFKEIDKNKGSDYSKTRNYFIHFPFYTSKKFYSCIEEFRSKVTDINENMKDFFYQQKFHVTLTTLFKLNEEQKQKVVQIIKENAKDLKEICSSTTLETPLKVKTSKIDCFANGQQHNKKLTRIGYVS